MYQEAFQSEKEKGRAGQRGREPFLEGLTSKERHAADPLFQAPSFGSVKLSHVKTAEMFFAGRISHIENIFGLICLSETGFNKINYHFCGKKKKGKSCVSERSIYSKQKMLKFVCFLLYVQLLAPPPLVLFSPQNFIP